MRGENAVAEIGFGCQAQARDGATCGHRADFVFIDVRGVHEAPALVHVEVVEQPAYWPRLQRLETGIDFSRLLRYVDMYRRAWKSAVESAEQTAQRFLRYRPQRMRRNAVSQVAVFGLCRAQRNEGVEQAFRRVDEPRLTGCWLPFTETAVLIKHGQH